MPKTFGEKTYFLTNEAAREIGVSRPTLLRWFREKRVADVSRDRRGWRTFSPEDVERLKRWAQRGG